MDSRYLIHCWLIDMASGSLCHQATAEQRRLGEYQLKLLIALAERAGKIVTREELTALVWERRVIGNNSLPNAIHALRIALNDDGKQQRIIKTIPRKGYILEAEYCRHLSPEEYASLTASDNPTPAVTKEFRPERAPQQLKRPPSGRFWRWLCLMQGVALFTLAAFLCR